MPPVDLDRWLGDPLVRTRHRRESRVGERELWAVAGTVRAAPTTASWPDRPARIPGLRSSETFYELFGGEPFNVLDEEPDLPALGAVWRIWTVRSNLRCSSAPADFLDVVSAGNGARCCSPTRRSAPGTAARRW